MLFSNYINDFRITIPEDLQTKPRICLFCKNHMYLTYNIGYVLSCDCGVKLHFSGYKLQALQFEHSDYSLSFEKYSSIILTHSDSDLKNRDKLGYSNEFRTKSCFINPVILDTEQLFDLDYFDLDYFDLSIFYRYYLNKDLL